jgi:fructose-1,6-bisphosphatase/inositol monophosphatase family enzyme
MKMVSEVMQVMIKASLRGMAEVQFGQRSAVGQVVTKQGDGQNTVVTKWDKVSEAAILAELKNSPYDVWSEEFGFVDQGGGQLDLVYLVDPLDGSKPFAIGAPTSTVSVALYNSKRKTVVACVVGEPATGKVMFAEEGSGTFVFYRSGDLKSDLLGASQVQTWSGKLGSGSVVLVDCYHGFALKDHPVTSPATWGRLMAALNNIGITYAMGTNCGHYALLALGRNSVAGVITTCRGGPHDITPGLLVSEAGGIVQSFSNKAGTLREVGPLAVMDANFMIGANDAMTAQRLVKIFKEVLVAV